MEIDLKKENSRNVFLIMAASLSASAFFQFDFKILSNFTDALIAGSLSLMLSVVLVMLTNIIPQAVKHKIIFTRLKHELPACRIDKLCKKDYRIEFEKVKSRWPDVFAEEIDGSIRNSRWYQQIYKTVKETPEVLQGHRSFLLYRDAFAGLLLIFLITLLWSLFNNLAEIGHINQMVFLVQGLLVFLSLIAARISGNRLVVNAVVAAV